MIYKFRKLIIFFVDLLFINLSVYLAFMVRFNWQTGSLILMDIIFFMVWASFIRVFLSIFFGLYQWSFRFASVSEMLNLFRVITIGSLLLIAVAFFTHKSGEMGRSILLIYYLYMTWLPFKR